MLGVTTLEYDLVDNIEIITDANNHTTSYDYDVLNRLITEKDAENQTTTYGYDDNGNLLTVVDAEGITTTLTYDGADRLASITNGEDETVTFAYDSLGNIVDLTQPNDVRIHWLYDGLYRPETLIQNFAGSEAPIAVTYQFTYDLNGNLKTVTDPENNTSLFDYDELNRLTRDENALGDDMVYGYDAADNLTSVEDRRNNTTTLRYDTADRLIEVENPLGDSAVYTYDKADNLLTYTDENGHTVTMTYDDLDRLETVSNPENDTVRFAYDAVGNLKTFTDARLNATTFDYDKVNRLVRTTDALGGETVLTYDQVGNVIAVQDANGHTTDIDYDRAYRTVKVTDAEGFMTQFEYDENGNVTKVIDGRGNPTMIDYDPLDRITAVTNAENETTAYTYDLVGNLEEIIEADGITKAYGYDDIYQLTSVTLNAGGVGAAWEADVVYRYGYDENGNLETITDPRTSVTTFTYDELNRVTREVNPIDKQWDYAYDKVGNLIDRIDGNRNTTTYDYYDDDQLHHIYYDDGDTVTFSYDANNNLTLMHDWLGTTTFVYDELNRITSVNDALQRELQYGYDAVGNVTAMTYPHGGTVEYEYLKNDWLRMMTDTAGNETVYTRNGVGQVTHTLRGNGATMDATYDRANRLTFLGHFEANGDPIQTTAYTLGRDDGSGGVQDVGLRTQAVTEYGRPWPKTVTETYEYDGLRRLTGVTDSDGFAGYYEYDAAGNRVSWQVNDDQTTPEDGDGFLTEYTYNAANQLLAAVRGDTTTTFAYDDNGNRINKYEVTAGDPYHFGTDYAYDRADRLTSVENYRINASLNPDHRRNREETVMEYDGMGRRLVKTYFEHEGRGRVDQTEYVFDGLDIVAEYPVYEDAEPIGRNNHRNEFYLNDQREIVTQRRFPNGVAAQTYQYHTDGRRDVVSLSDETNRAWVHYDYDAYGQLLPEWGNLDHPENRDHNHFTFSGQYWNTEVQLVEYLSRSYSTATATWVSQDYFRGFLRLPETLARYGFVAGNPIEYVDYYGYGFGDWAKDKWDKANEKLNDAKDWVGEHKEQIASVATGIVVGAAVTVGVGALCAATAGLGCMVAAGALAGAAAGGASTAVGNVVGGRPWHQDFVKNTIIGGVTGAVTAGLSYALPGVVQAATQQLGRFGSGVIGTVMREGINAIGSGFVSGVGNAIAQIGSNLWNGCALAHGVGDSFREGFGTGVLTYGGIRLGQAGLRYGLKNTSAGKNLVENRRRDAVKQAWKKQAPNYGYDAASGQHGLQGHHQYSVKAYPELAGDSTFIEFLTRQEHINVHNGNWRNPTHGPQWWK